MGLYWGYILGLNGNNGKEHGNYYLMCYLSLSPEESSGVYGLKSKFVFDSGTLLLYATFASEFRVLLGKQNKHAQKTLVALS